eukprot:s8_g38.t1
MGKGGKYAKNYYQEEDHTWRPAGRGQHYGGNGGGGRGQGWSWWPGAWKSPRRKSDASDGHNRSQLSSFPAYDAGWRQATEMMEVSSSTKAPSRGNSGIVMEVQNAVNSARRLEQRLSKLQKEMLQKGQAWDSWVLEMRAAYAKEHDRHKAEQTRLTAEIRDLEVQHVQHTALHRQPGAAAPPPLQWEGDMEIDEELTEDQTRLELERILGRAQGPVGPAPSTPPRRPGTAPRSPSHTAGGPIPATGGSPPAATADAYPSPPETSSRMGGDGPATGLTDPRSIPVVPESATVPTSLANKLSEKRRAYRSAMGPFGLTRLAGARSTDDVLGGPDTGRTSAVDTGPLIDDDNEELNTASPGFGNME